MRPKEHFLYPPLINPKRFNGVKYNDWQNALWQALNDVYHARTFGYIQNRRPSVFFKYNEEEFRKWKEKVTYRWAYESGSRGEGMARGLEDSDFTELEWLYFYERMLAANNAGEDIKAQRTAYGYWSGG